MQFRSSIILCENFSTLLLVVAKEVFHRQNNTWIQANTQEPISCAELSPPNSKHIAMDGVPNIRPCIVIDQDTIPMRIDTLHFEDKEQTLTMIWKIVYGFHALSVPPFQTMATILQEVPQSSGGRAM